MDKNEISMSTLQEEESEEENIAAEFLSKDDHDNGIVSKQQSQKNNNDDDYSNIKVKRFSKEEKLAKIASKPSRSSL